ncbi:kinesin-like nuclear fusion protein [Sparganum proliferum]
MNKLLQHLKDGISSIDDIISLYESEDSEQNNNFFLCKRQKSKNPAELPNADSLSESESSDPELPNNRRLSTDEPVQRKASQNMETQNRDAPQERLSVNLQQDKVAQSQEKIPLTVKATGYGDEEIAPPPRKPAKKQCPCGRQFRRKTVSEICQLTAINAQLGEKFAQLRTEYVKLTADYSRLQYRHDLLKVAALKGRQVLEDSSEMGSEIANLKKKLFNSAVERESLCSKVNALQEELRQANSRLHFLQTLVPELQDKVVRREAVIEALMRDRELNAARDIQTRMMRTELMNLKGQIRLLVRCSPDEDPDGCIDILSENSLVIQRPYDEMRSNKKRSGQLETLEVFRVYKPGSGQSDIFRDVEDYVVSAVDG